MFEFHKRYYFPSHSVKTADTNESYPCYSCNDCYLTIKQFGNATHANLFQFKISNAIEQYIPKTDPWVLWVSTPMGHRARSMKYE